MRKNISKAKDDYLEKIFKYIKIYFFERPKDQQTWESFAPGLESIIYDSLAETYSITANAAEKIYNIKFEEIIDEDTLKELTYSEDGKSLDERLEKHFNDAIKRDNPKDYLYNRIVLIMDTETLYASNHVIHGKLKRRATHAEVVNGDNQACEEHPECEHWLKQGKIPIEELKELPPYHPDCECEVIYYLDEE
jgi:hypothetical protein